MMPWVYNSLLQSSASIRKFLPMYRHALLQTLCRHGMVTQPSIRQAHCCAFSIRRKTVLHYQHQPDQGVVNRIVKFTKNPHNKWSHMFSRGPHSTSYRMSSTFAELSATSHLYYRILESLPQGIQMAFAYGSGVYQQAGHADMNRNMLDFILVVDNPLAWHNENVKRNSNHYSFLKYFGGRSVAAVQEYGAGKVSVRDT